jgi:hypothetical protein
MYIAMIRNFFQTDQDQLITGQFHKVRHIEPTDKLQPLHTALVDSDNQKHF